MARKSGIIAGILMWILIFIYKIPLFFIEKVEINFKIFSEGNIDYTFWGYVSSTSGFTSISLSYPESYVALILFLIAFFIGLISIMASTSKANIPHSLILYQLNIILILLLLIIYGVMIIFLNLNDLIAIFFPFFEKLGLGYYLLLLVLILNIIALKKLKKLIKE